MDHRLPPRYAFRLEDLRAWHVVLVRCGISRHQTVLAPAALAKRRPGYTRLVDLEGRLRCLKCGARGRAWLLVELRPRENRRGRMISARFVVFIVQLANETTAA
jgi:hypothetical protein